MLLLRPCVMQVKKKFENSVDVEAFCGKVRVR
jgi:hypothetical protein